MLTMCVSLLGKKYVLFITTISYCIFRLNNVKRFSSKIVNDIKPRYIFGKKNEESDESLQQVNHKYYKNIISKVFEIL